MFSRWKMKKCLSRTPKTFFVQSRAGRKNIQNKTNHNKKQHLGHFPQKKKEKEKERKEKKHAQHSSRFLTERKKKLQHSLNPDVTRRRGIHFETLVFLYTFLYMHDLAKLCNDKLCKSAFHKSLAKQNNRKKKTKNKTKPQNGHSTRRYWKELHVGSTYYSQSRT